MADTVLHERTVSSGAESFKKRSSMTRILMSIHIGGIQDADHRQCMKMPVRD